MNSINALEQGCAVHPNGLVIMIKALHWEAALISYLYIGQALKGARLHGSKEWIGYTNDNRQKDYI